MSRSAIANQKAAHPRSSAQTNIKSNGLTASSTLKREHPALKSATRPAGYAMVSWVRLVCSAMRTPWSSVRVPFFGVSSRTSMIASRSLMLSPTRSSPGGVGDEKQRSGVLITGVRQTFGEREDSDPVDCHAGKFHPAILRRALGHGNPPGPVLELGGSARRAVEHDVRWVGRRCSISPPSPIASNSGGGVVQPLRVLRS